MSTYGRIVYETNHNGHHGTGWDGLPEPAKTGYDAEGMAVASQVLREVIALGDPVTMHLHDGEVVIHNIPAECIRGFAAERGIETGAQE